MKVEKIELFVSKQNCIISYSVFTRTRRKEPVKPNSDLSYAANFLYMLKRELPSDTEVEAFNKA